MLRRTPCVGICSTTYGDLVCRGCKRFAHEIVQWNGFDDGQRRIIWQRLLKLRAGAVADALRIDDECRLRAAAVSLGLNHPDLDPANLLYEVLQRLRWREQRPRPDALGVRVQIDAAAPLTLDVESLLVRIDREFYQRSLADYERNYRIPAQ